jgi:hypothetical protein
MRIGPAIVLSVTLCLTATAQAQHQNLVLIGLAAVGFLFCRRLPRCAPTELQPSRLFDSM